MVQNCLRKFKPARKVLTSCVFLLACSVSAFARNLNLLWSPLFPGVSLTDCYPLKIVVENSGPKAVGELVVQSAGVAVHYPVNVESGRKQSFLAYPLVPDGMHPLQFDLNTDQEDDEIHGPNPPREYHGLGIGNTVFGGSGRPRPFGSA